MQKLRRLGKNSLSAIQHFRTQFALMFMTLLASNMAQAALPTVANPTSGAPTAGDYVGAGQAYLKDILVLGGLGLSTICFLLVVKNVMSTYNKVADNQATMGQVAVHAGVGVMLLVLVVFLATEAATIL